MSAVGGIPEIVETGKTGYLIEPADGRALRTSLESLLANRDLARDMGAKGRARVEARFDARATADRIFAHLATIAKPAEREPIGARS